MKMEWFMLVILTTTVYSYFSRKYTCDHCFYHDSVYLFCSVLQERNIILSTINVQKFHTYSLKKI